MIEYVHELLVDWGEWLRDGPGINLGCGNITEGESLHGSGKVLPNRNPEAEKMDLVICKLSKKQKKSVIARYFYQWSDRQAAEHYGISYAAHEDRIYRAHINIDRMWSVEYEKVS